MSRVFGDYSNLCPKPHKGTMTGRDLSFFLLRSQLHFHSTNIKLTEIHFTVYFRVPDFRNLVLAHNELKLEYPFNLVKLHKPT